MLLWQKEHFIYVKLYQQLLTAAEVYLNRSDVFTKAIIDMAKNIVYKLHKYTYLCQYKFEKIYKNQYHI